ncbi:zinc finger CCCH domain-containing protein 53-like isoform X2 [Aristolochia californica]|uniref:zinc finger CCCH domain-containing protein 53-like isoform X2 n=1 Tax=Aristolochia californica TaxID=171875 RepID=UPI0035D87C1F
MDAYEATRIVFSRIQSLDPENAPKIMGLLLIQDHGDKEMIRLAFGPEALLHSLVLKARKDLGLLPATTPSTPSSSLSSPFFSRQHNSSASSSSSSSSLSSRLVGVSSLPLSLSMPSSSSWVSNSAPFLRNGMVDLQSHEELLGPNSAYGVNVGSSSCSSNSSSFFGGGGSSDLMEDLQLQDHLSFLNDPAVASASPTVSIGLSKMNNNGASGGDLFYPPESPTSPSEAGLLFQYGNWGANGHHRRSCSVADVDLIGGGFGWKPCLYFARGYCKNGSSCRFLHGPPDSAADGGAGKQLDVLEHCQELLRSKSQRLVSQIMPPSPSFPFPNANKCMNFLLQQQGQNDSQKSPYSAAAVAALMLGDESHKFGSRSMMRMERNDFAAGAGMVNPGSRQIYLTFPADSTFREEDVSNYFSIYGPVQDVRIPYQQKRMFGFVTFVYPETVKLILAKGNPHFVCDARVLVKPYKEKGKVPDKKQTQQQPERGDFAACSASASLESRERYDLQQLSARMLYNNSHEVMLRRKLEEQADIQQAIELQGRRLMGLQLLDVSRRNLSGASPLPSPSFDTFSHYDPNSPDGPEGTCHSPAATVHPPSDQHQLQKFHINSIMQVSDNEANVNECAAEERLQQESNYPENNNVEHNLPDSPFASPTKSLTDPPSLFTCEAAERSCSSPVNITCGNATSSSIPIASSLFSGTSSLDMASFKSCFLQMPRFSSGHGAIGM